MSMNRLVRCGAGLLGAALAALLLLLSSDPASAQEKGAARANPPGLAPAGYNDYQNMLDQLGIKRMRRGRNARVPDTSREATANSYKETMPDLMTFQDGTKVTSPEQWPRRRAELVELFERELYGRIPRGVPRVDWEVTRTVEGKSGEMETLTRTLVGHVDNSSFPQIKVAIQASYTVPRNAKGRVPMILQFGFGFGGRAVPSSWTQQALDKGWGHGTIVPNSIQPDNNKLREGIIGLTNKGLPRSPEDWGALRLGLGLGREPPDRLLRGELRLWG